MSLVPGLGIAAGVVAATLAGRWAIHRTFRVPRQTATSTPDDHGLVGETVRIATVNGKILLAWLIPAPANHRPAPAVLLMHGWGADCTTLLPLAAPLHHAGIAVLLIDARNHGRSDGDSFSSMPRFAEDIEAGLDWLKQRPEIDVSRLGLIGHSVGGAAALLVGSRRRDLAAIVSLSAFDHPERVMRTYLDRAHLPYRPLGWLVCRYVERVIGHRFDAIAPVNTVARITCPLLIGHGANDTLVPCAAAHAIHARAAATAQLRILADTDHEGCADMDRLGHLLADFLATSLSVPPQP